MTVRRYLGLTVAAPALVLALVQPSSAASIGAVTFSGIVQITPTASGAEQVLDACFFGLAQTCVNGAESTGAASGTAAYAVGVDAIDGLAVSGTYREMCAPGTVLPAVGHATLLITAHDAISETWRDEFAAGWTRVGGFAVLTGAANGVASFTPLGVPVCGQPLLVEVSGTAQVSY